MKLNKTKHTPGPWTFSLLTTSEHNPIIHCGTEPSGVSSMNLEAIMYRDDEEMKANFNLVIAAPDMLETLENLRDNFDYPTKAYELILNAIARAKGEHK